MLPEMHDYYFVPVSGRFVYDNQIFCISATSPEMAARTLDCYILENDSTGIWTLFVPLDVYRKYQQMLPLVNIPPNDQITFCLIDSSFYDLHKPIANIGG